ncbi:MAG: CDP-glucose 4,6-dehydratase [Flavobacteriales bacterium]
MGNKPGRLENMVDNSIHTFYKNKRVFLTGHTGFKGAWLLTWLYSMGAVVKGYALHPVNKADLYNVINGQSMCDSVIADIRDKEKLKKEIIDFKPDVIFHMAAQPLVGYSYSNPMETFEVNTIGTAAVLDTLRWLEKKCSVVIITTDKVYENHESPAYKETDRLGGYDPYSASKAAAELVVTSYRNSYFNINQFDSHQKSIASARAGNVIGGGDWSRDRIIPDIIKALLANEKVIVRNPKAVRPWQYVLDPLHGYLLLALNLDKNHQQFSGAWNFGPENNDQVTVQQVVETAIKKWGHGSFEISDKKSEFHETALLTLDITKACRELNWLPRNNSQQSIDKTIEWYKQPSDKLKEVTFSEIKNF